MTAPVNTCINPTFLITVLGVSFAKWVAELKTSSRLRNVSLGSVSAVALLTLDSCSDSC